MCLWRLHWSKHMDQHIGRSHHWSEPISCRGHFCHYTSHWSNTFNRASTFNFREPQWCFTCVSQHHSDEGVVDHRQDHRATSFSYRKSTYCWIHPLYFCGMEGMLPLVQSSKGPLNPRNGSLLSLFQGLSLSPSTLILRSFGFVTMSTPTHSLKLTAAKAHGKSCGTFCKEHAIFYERKQWTSRSPLSW
jgi:hypothetical protein